MNPEPIRLWQRYRERFWLAVVLFVAAVILFIVTVFPLNRARQEVKSPTGFTQGGTLQPAVLENRQIVLEWPLKVREKDGAIIELEIAMDEQGRLTATAGVPGQPSVKVPINAPDLYSTYNLVAVGRLDMAGVEAFREERREPLQPGREVVFHWIIRADAARVYRGVVWLHLDLVPKSGAAVERVLLLARTVEVEAVTVFGLSGSAARCLGILGMAASVWLGYPFILDWVKLKHDRQKIILSKEQAAQ
jgi:hypothetical protein